MKFLADENFPGPVLRRLRDRGFDIDWITESARGSSDEAVLALAVQDRRTLLTFDKDFGELAFRHGLPATSGVVLFRLADLPLDIVIAGAITALAEDAKFGNGASTHPCSRNSQSGQRYEFASTSVPSGQRKLERPLEQPRIP